MLAKISRIGCKKIKDPRLKRYIMILNKMAIFSVMIDLGVGLFFYLLGFHSPAIVLLISAFAFGSLILCNHFQRYNASRLLFSFFGVTVISLVSLYFGEKSYTHTILFVAACSPFCMISPKEYSIWGGALALPIVAFAILKAMDFSAGFQVDAWRFSMNESIIQVIMWGFTFSFLGLISYFFTSQQYRYEHELQRVIGKLEVENASRLRAEKKLEKANTQNEMLVSILCHDIVNSLISLKYSVGDLKRQLPEEYALEESLSSIAMMEGNVENIFSLITHVRKVRDTVSGGITLNLVPLCLGDILSRTQKIFKPMLERKRLTLHLTASEPLEHLYVLAEETILVNEVLSNVLSNAIKFSYESSSIDVLVQESFDNIRISIRDYGAGIPQKTREQLFTLSIKASQPGTLGERGSGMGLSLVKSHVELLNGKVWAESKTEEESTHEHGTVIHLEFAKVEVDKAQEDLLAGIDNSASLASKLT